MNDRPTMQVRDDGATLSIPLNTMKHQWSAAEEKVAISLTRSYEDGSFHARVFVSIRPPNGYGFTVNVGPMRAEVARYLGEALIAEANAAELRPSLDDERTPEQVL